MPEKNIPDVIQGILEKNKGFANVKNLPSMLSAELRQELGIKNGLTGPVIRKKLEPYLEDRFIFHKKGALLYILIPCEPSELVISMINSSRSASPKMIAKSLPFTKKEFLEIINSLIEEGRAKLVLTENLDVKIIFIDNPVKKAAETIASTITQTAYDDTVTKTPDLANVSTEPETAQSVLNEAEMKTSGSANVLPENTEPAITQSSPAATEITPSVQTGEEGGKRDYGPGKFREAFYALDKGRIFVNIYELRRKLNWPREVFDAMLIKLRDEEVIQLHVGDASTMTPEELNDNFVDENNFRMGTVTWNDGK